MSDRRLVYYTGKHLGASPQSRLRGGDKHVTWRKGMVRSIPTADAADLLRSRTSFLEAMTPTFAAKQFGVAADDLKGVTTAQYVKQGELPKTVIVLDDATLAALNSSKSKKTTTKKGGK